jgi:DNA polymerase epsilon subunit 1
VHAPHHLSHPETSQPNCYTDICVEVQLCNLVINTILESQHVHELEGATAATGLAFTGDVAADDDTTLLPLDDTAQCWRAFRIFKALATKVCCWSSMTTHTT